MFVISSMQPIKSARSVYRSRDGDKLHAKGDKAECSERIRVTERVYAVVEDSQGVYKDRAQVSSLLGLVEEAVQVTLIPNGGGFGGKEDMSVQGQTALAAYLLQRPVRIELEELR